MFGSLWYFSQSPLTYYLPTEESDFDYCWFHMVVLWGHELLLPPITPKYQDLNCWTIFFHHPVKTAHPVEVHQYLTVNGCKSSFPTGCLYPYSPYCDTFVCMWVPHFSELWVFSLTNIYPLGMTLPFQKLNLHSTRFSPWIFLSSTLKRVIPSISSVWQCPVFYHSSKPIRKIKYH